MPTDDTQAPPVTPNPGIPLGQMDHLGPIHDWPDIPLSDPHWQQPMPPAPKGRTDADAPGE